MSGLPRDGSSVPSGGVPEILVRVLSGVALAAVAIAAAWLGGYFFFAFWGIAAAVVWVEWIRITRSGGAYWWLLGGVVASFIVLGPIVLRNSSLLGLQAIFWLFVVVWTTDIMAYATGRVIGGPKLWTRISPKKTWAGFIGGIFFALIGGLLAAIVMGLPSFLGPACLAVLLALATHSGDLMESAVKRRFGVKDAGHVIPGHGGVLDRLDGFAIASAIAALLGVWRGGFDDAARGLLVW